MLFAVLFSAYAFASPISLGLPNQEFEGKVLAAIRQKCDFVAIEEARTKTFPIGDQSNAAYEFNTEIEASYFYDGHPVVGTISVHSEVWNEYTDKRQFSIGSVESKSVGLCEKK